MSSLSQVLPFFIPVMLSVQPGHAAPTSSIAELYLRDRPVVHPHSGSHQVDSQAENSLQRHPAAVAVDSQTEISGRALVVPVPAPSWLSEAVHRINGYAVLSDDWKGPGSLAPTLKVREEAKELAGQIALEIPDVPRPSIGADDEGAITLHWAVPTMSATMTAYGDGTYAYYAESSDQSDRSDSEVIGAPLPERLIRIMALDAIFGLLTV